MSISLTTIINNKKTNGEIAIAEIANDIGRQASYEREAILAYTSELERRADRQWWMDPHV